MFHSVYRLLKLKGTILPIFSSFVQAKHFFNNHPIGKPVMHLTVGGIHVCNAVSPVYSFIGVLELEMITTMAEIVCKGSCTGCGRINWTISISKLDNLY